MDKPILWIIIIGLVVFFVIRRARKKAARKQQLYEAYLAALRSGNKEVAHTAGQAYYGFMRKGDLTISDERALKYDLSTMKGMRQVDNSQEAYEPG